MLPPFVRNITEYVPSWVLGLALLWLTAVLAFVIFQVLRSLLQRIPNAQHPILRAILRRAESLLRFALILLAVTLIIPALPFGTHTAHILHRILIASFVVLMGWIAIVASNLAADRYMLRFRLDAEDNLQARKAVTQVRVLKRTASVTIGVLTLGCALMTFDTVREYGVSIFASAGVAGIALGLAAKPVLGNFIAGIQIAIAQPIRIDDAVIIEGEFGRIEEFTSSYVVVKLWDLRRMIVPLSYFLENPFQNWTRASQALLASVNFYLDYSAPIAHIRVKLEEFAKQSPNWDGDVVNLQVTDATERTIKVRALLSARNASLSSNLQSEIREKMLTFLQEEHPYALPRLRTQSAGDYTEAPPR